MATFQEANQHLLDTGQATISSQARGDDQTFYSESRNLLTCVTEHVAFNNIGQLCRSHAMLLEAEICYRRAIAVNPDYTLAYNNLGAVLQETGRSNEAVELYQHALTFDAGFFEAWCNLANALQDLGEYQKAEYACRQAVALRPLSAAAYNILGMALQHLGRLDEAEQAFRQALSLKPDFALAYSNLATVLHALGMPEAAVENCHRALDSNPGLAAAYKNMGASLRELDRLAESEQALLDALTLMPGDAEAYSSLAATLKKRGQLEAAKDACHKALMYNPRLANAWNNLGVINLQLGMPEEAFSCYQQAIALNSDHADAHFNLALFHLLKGNFTDGWHEYEWRLKSRKDLYSGLNIPRYDGSGLEGKTLFIYSEQAVGEELQFSSCLPDAAAITQSCLFECDARLVPLFSRSFPSITVVPAPADTGTGLHPDLPQPDYRLPLGSLPLYFRNSPVPFQQRAPWLLPCPKAARKWHDRYDALGNGLKVGISWRGGSSSELRRLRSTTLQQWESLFAVSGINFINLQYGSCADELAAIRSRLGITIHSWDDADPLHDLDDFAAQVSTLDLVISIDNSTVHMAGAVGCQVWCLVPHVPDWRWMLHRYDSPWYPTMRIFRQRQAQQWAPVFEEVAMELVRLIR